jgi:hypothetical protein
MRQNHTLSCDRKSAEAASIANEDARDDDKKDRLFTP